MVVTPTIAEKILESAQEKRKEEEQEPIKVSPDDLIKQIYEKLPNSEAVKGKLDEYGQRYTVDLLITGPNGNTVTVRTSWIIKTGFNIPELTTLFVKD